MVEIVVGGAIFDRSFYKGFHGGVPDIHESRMLIIKRSESEGKEWAGGRWTPLTESYERADSTISKQQTVSKNVLQPIQVIMENVLRRGFEEELRPEGLALTDVNCIGNYKDNKTGILVYTYLGHIYNNSPWSPARNLKKGLHPYPKEIEKIDWKTLPEIIEMTKKDKFANEQFLDNIIQEIERRAARDAKSFPAKYLDELSRLKYNIPRTL
ncbi:hypothetical protein A3K64_03620 [Candidatus Micrarchaeota archaeon RBG_16_36_9]|nr:MAG: hypothetical protein A3K64_03620 [Candidatus Micrarchaeota archaeon RBG_16_36_9]